MKSNKIAVLMDLPEEEIKELKYLYIVIDSDYNIHYELNNKGHIILPIHFSEINPFRIYKNLPKNLIKKCKSDKSNIIGVLQLWIYYANDYVYGRIRGFGILENFKGNRIKTILKLVRSMDSFCRYQGIKFVETETSVIPLELMARFGFQQAPSRNLLDRVAQKFFRQTAYIKKY